MGSVLCLSEDHSSFYVGYSFSGVVEKYSVDTGLLVCSIPAHYGDVYTLTVVQLDVVCTSGSDGQVRLIQIKSNNSTVTTSTSKPTVSLSPDEVAYHRMCQGLSSIRLILPQDEKLPFKVMVCSFGAPQLISLRNSLSVQSLGSANSDNIGKYSTVTLV